MHRGIIMLAVATSGALAVGAAFFFALAQFHDPEPVLNAPPVSIEPEPEPEPAPPIPSEELDSGVIPQFVLLAFDGSYSIDMWERTRAFAQEATETGAPVQFTYFINTAYLLTPENKDIYHPPQHPQGTSAILFAPNATNVAQRIEQMNLAIEEGHEIGSHAVGHFDGSTWSEAEWRSELTQFATHIDGTIDLPVEGIVGFRAPELGVSEGLWPVLAELGYRYDASTTNLPADAWPTQNNEGIWSLSLPHIPYAANGHAMLAMDYTFYFQQTGARDTLVKGTPEWQNVYDATLRSYLDYFERNFSTTRAPVYMANHFSLWNDGLYWDVMRAFALTVCGQQDVRCVTHEAFTDYLDSQHVTPPNHVDN